MERRRNRIQQVSKRPKLPASQLAHPNLRADIALPY